MNKPTNEQMQPVPVTGVKAIVTDIEGTTSSISFVVDELFPFARKRLPAFVIEHHEETEVAHCLDEVRRETGDADADLERIGEILCQWIDEDKKVTPLKTLQGMVWQYGYESGELKGHLYQDAYEQLKRWHDEGMRMFVYSSGSVGAQKLLFGYSSFGDLTPWFENYFDTRIGHKRESSSYQTIVDSIQLPAQQILFLSDIQQELDAAKSVGMQTIGLDRDQKNEMTGHDVVSSFEQIQFA